MLHRQQFVIPLAVVGFLAAASCQSTNPQSTTTLTLAPTQPVAVATQPSAPAPVAPAHPTTSTAVSPEMMDALKQLTADDFKARQDAVTKLQEMMARQFQEMVLVQNLMLQIQEGLTEQLRTMTQMQDPEGQARVAGLFEFNYALSHWAIDVIALPKAESDRILKWGMQKENLPLIGRAYHRSDDVRSAAAKSIAKIDGPEADWLLLQLLNDNSREVALGALDAIYDRKPCAKITTALWERAIISLNQYRNRPSKNRTLNLHGRMVNIYEDNNYNNRMQDVDVAVDVLIKQKDPQVVVLLDNLFMEMALTINNNNDYRWRALSPNYGGDSGRSISRLVEAFKPRQAVVFYAKALTSNANDGSDTTMNNDKVRYSSRIDFAASFVQIIGQDPEDYGMKKYQNWGDRWLIKGTVVEEEAMVKKLQAWWKEHGAEFTDGAATRPAKPKAAAPEETLESKATAAMAADMDQAAHAMEMAKKEKAMAAEAAKRAEAERNAIKENAR